jgi:predicted Zn-dependent protease
VRGSVYDILEYMKRIDASAYVGRAKRLLQKRYNVRALEILKAGLEAHPDNAFLLSYYGALLAIVSKNHREGVRAAERALKLLVATVPLEAEAHYPLFYLNIARAYLAAGDRKRAILALKKGLRYDSFNLELLETMDSLGVRRRPPIPSLKRTNLLNKYIGMLLHKLGK